MGAPSKCFKLSPHSPEVNESGLPPVGSDSPRKYFRFENKPLISPAVTNPVFRVDNAAGA
jgi:hypothetical protein